MAICNLRARVAILWLVLTLLIIGVVVWAISAEVVMGAMRESVRKNSDTSTLRLHHQNFDNSDDFSIHRINNKVGHSIKSGIRHSETALIREVDKQSDSKRVQNNRLKSGDDFYSYDQRSDEAYNSEDDEEEDESEEAQESVGIDKKISTTKQPLSVSFDFEKLRKGITREQIAKVIDQLMGQTKNKEGKVPQIVAVEPTQVSTKKSKTNKSSTKLLTKSQKYSKSSSKTTTTTTTTTSKPSTTRTTLKPFGRSRIQSLSLKLANSALTTTKPKRTKFKVSTIKIRRTTTTTTPPTTTTTPTTRKPIPTTKSRQRSRKTSLKSSKNSASKLTTTTSTTESSKNAELELFKSKIRQKELEFILNKVESLEKQQKKILKQSNRDPMVMESSFRDSVGVKPKYEVISFKQKQPDFSPSYSSHHNYDTQDMTHNTQKNNGWQPTQHSPPSIHLPPPPPPPPPIPNGPPHLPPPPPPTSVFHNQENFHQMGPQQHMIPPPPPHQYSEPQGMTHFAGNPMPEPNMNPIRNNEPMIPMRHNYFNGILPIPNRGPHNSGGSEPQMAQESHPMEYHVKQRGHSVQKTEKPGIQLSFGGGPMGGGGQLKTSPMGIFKTLLLPLLPKPRMNLNGKVVFGVVLENGVGFGKKPKIVAQHFSTGRI